MDRIRGDGETDVKHIRAEVFERLEQFDWPGNVRQLRNVMHRACVLSGNEVPRINDLPLLETPSAEAREHKSLYGMSLEEAERHIITFAIRTTAGASRFHAARPT